MVQPQVRSCVQGRCGAAGGAAAHRSAEHLSKSFQRAGLEEAVSSPRGAGDEPRFMSRSLGTISAICRRTRGRDRRSARLISGTGTGRQVAHRSHKLRVEVSVVVLVVVLVLRLVLVLVGGVRIDRDQFESFVV